MTDFDAPTSLWTKVLTVEASLWMGRVHLLGQQTFILIGWYAAVAPDGTPDPLPLIGLCTFLFFGFVALQILNDVKDVEGDRITAPYLPLPSGLLSVRTAARLAVAYMGVGLLALLLTLPHLFWVVVILATTGAAAGILVAYSKLKGQGVLASAIITVAFALPLLWAWFVAGGGDPIVLVTLVFYTQVTYFSGNIIAALHDVDLDERAGNTTFPVRVGAPRAFRFMVGVAGVGWLLVPVIALLGPYGMWALPFIVPGLALLAVSYRRMLRTLQVPDRGRLRRIDDLGPMKVSDQFRNAAVLAVFAPWVALVAFAVIQAIAWSGHYLYMWRIVRGGLVRSLAQETGAGLPGPDR
ncbi:UbiA family prenyltransferase [Nonomuraea sp. NPDC048826]|uniref:UbiA family prenyltransferase n=1 Tax=Nonomuraea sp. NPDC048826 TaxID=3364347 RepID=UPI003714557C